MPRFRLSIDADAMDPFVYSGTANGLASHVIFGSGTLARVGDELARLGSRSALVLSTGPQQALAEDVARRLGAKAAGVFSGAVMHTPVEVTEQALARLGALGADSVVAIGGGSTIGLGKALALRTDIAQIAVPTTYAGSEMTPILGQTERGTKTVQRSPKVLPEVVIYDVDLTLSLPAGLSASSGLNAMAHAVEALYARDGNPIISMASEEAVKVLATALPRLIVNPLDRPARTEALYGAWLCGLALGAVGMSLHHKLCHTLGGAFDLPHAETHAVILPHALAYNAAAVPESVQRLSLSLGVEDPAQGLFDLARTLGTPASLQELGMPEAGISRVVEAALADPYWNPRPLERDAIEALLRSAWKGEPPRPPG